MFKLDRDGWLKIYLWSYFIVAAIQGFCGSVVQIYMIKHISEQFFKVYRSLDMLIPIVILLYFKSNVKIVKLRRYFAHIIGFSTIAFTIANIGGMWSPEFRFMTICLIEGFGSFLWIMVMDDLFNQIFQKTDLTVWNNKNQLYRMSGVFIGALIVISVDIDVNTCLILQCIAYVYLGVMDWTLFSKFKNEYKVYDTAKEEIKE